MKKRIILLATLLVASGSLVMVRAKVDMPKGVKSASAKAKAFTASMKSRFFKKPAIDESQPVSFAEIKQVMKSANSTVKSYSSRVNTGDVRSSYTNLDGLRGIVSQQRRVLNYLSDKNLVDELKYLISNIVNNNAFINASYTSLLEREKAKAAALFSRAISVSESAIAKYKEHLKAGTVAKAYADLSGLRSVLILQKKVLTSFDATPVEYHDSNVPNMIQAIEDNLETLDIEQAGRVMKDLPELPKKPSGSKPKKLSVPKPIINVPVITKESAPEERASAAA